MGSTVILTFDYGLPEEGQLPEEPVLAGLEGLTVVDREVGPGQIKVRFLVDRLHSWKTGPLGLSYLDKEGKLRTLKAEPVSIAVLSNLEEKPEEAQIRPIQGIIPTEALWRKFLPWSAGILGFLLVLAGIVWWKRRRRIQALYAEVLDPPHIRAIRDLEGLLSQGLFEGGQVKGFYFRFSEILRQYLGEIRGFPAVDFTTEEIALRINNEQDRLLLPLLREADLVKFADSVPTPARKEEEMKTAFAYIDRTAPVDEAGHSTDKNSQTEVHS